jgi:hypothetical protein
MARGLAYVLEQINAGKTIKFRLDFYGRQNVQVRTAWIWRVQVPLTDQEILDVRRALQNRRWTRRAQAS